MDITITIADELMPGIVAAANLEAKDPKSWVNSYAEELARKICQDMKVGPYYVGPLLPQFNADGTLYGTEPAAADENVVEPAIEDKDTNEPGEVTV